MFPPGFKTFTHIRGYFFNTWIIWISPWEWFGKRGGKRKKERQMLLMDHNMSCNFKWRKLLNKWQPTRLLFSNDSWFRSFITLIAGLSQSHRIFCTVYTFDLSVPHVTTLVKTTTNGHGLSKLEFFFLSFKVKKTKIQFVFEKLKKKKKRKKGDLILTSLAVLCVPTMRMKEAGCLSKRRVCHDLRREERQSTESL